MGIFTSQKPAHSAIQGFSPQEIVYQLTAIKILVRIYNKMVKIVLFKQSN